MTPISPQDRSKAVFLVMAVLAVFGFIAWRAIGFTAPESKSPEVIRLDSATKGSTTSGAASTAPATVVEMVTPANADQVDPFRAVLPATTSAPGAGQIPSPARLSSGRQGLGPGYGPLVPAVGPEFPTAEPKLTGVMSGDPPIGVFLVAGKEEILRVGEVMSNGFVVESIQGQTAILAKKKTRKRLTITPS